MNKPVRRTALLAMLVALTLILGWLENLIPLPLPVPGLKLGLSNIVLLFALYTRGAKSSLLLLAAKVTLSSLLFAGFSAFAYALTGGLFALGGMTLLKNRKGFSLIGVSVAGAVLHNIGQVAAAVVLLGTVQIVRLLSVLLVAGVATGALTGFAASLVLSALERSGALGEEK